MLITWQSKKMSCPRSSQKYLKPSQQFEDECVNTQYPEH